MTITAEVVADSVNTVGNRITTMRLRYPRLIHSEFMTHRMFSRNARSSRAVPVETMIEEVLTDPAIPVRFGSNKPGMQDGGNHDAPVGRWGYDAETAWRAAATAAAHHARMFHDAGYHKQVCNRLIEPFQHIDVIVTATEWDNFYALRCHEDADPTIRTLADAMRSAHDTSTPAELKDGEIHMPLGKTRGASVAACARVSYGRSEGRSNADDIRLYEMLKSSGHWSPFEHQAQAASGKTCRNFKGWVQLRAVLDGS